MGDGTVDAVDAVDMVDVLNRSAGHPNVHAPMVCGCGVLEFV